MNELDSNETRGTDTATLHAEGPNVGPFDTPALPARTQTDPTDASAAPLIPQPTFSHGRYEAVYHHRSQTYFLRMPSQKWVEMKSHRLKDHLIHTYGLSGESQKGQLSPVDHAMHLIDQQHTVDLVANIGGFREGVYKIGGEHILVKSSPNFITPRAGDWAMLKDILTNMLGETQLLHFYGWLKMALSMFTTQTWMAGQALILCGPPKSGKNLLTSLVQVLFGGREPGKPYDFMTQKTTFNSDVISAELLTIEDEISHTDIKKRRAFGARIKDLAVNKPSRLHKKYADGVTVQPLQRLIISLNDEPERLQILPPVDHDIADKMMIFKVERHEMPMPTDTPAAEKAFGDALIAQLPAFLDFLEQWTIPINLKASRTGIAHYHHPDILEMLGAQAPETELLRLIDEVLFPLGTALSPWQGRAIDLERKLLNSSIHGVLGEVRRLLFSTNCCGRHLARLAGRNDGRVTKHPGHAGIHNWTIFPPDGLRVGLGHTAIPAAATKLLERFRAKAEAKAAEETQQAA